MSPVDQAVWEIEFTIRHGPREQTKPRFKTLVPESEPGHLEVLIALIIPPGVVLFLLIGLWWIVLKCSKNKNEKKKNN